MVCFGAIEKKTTNNAFNLFNKAMFTKRRREITIYTN